MTDQNPETETGQAQTVPASATRRRTRRRIGTGLTVGGLVLALGIGGLYAGRRTVAEEVLVGWLHRRGIQADVEVQRIEWDGFIGRITVGNPDDPDVRIDKVEVDYLIGLPWMAEGFGLTPRRVVLDRPVVKAEWTGSKLSFGSLDPLIEELTSRPPGPRKPGPIVLVQQGRALLATPYGAISATADARLNDNRLEWLKASLSPADLKLRDIEAKQLAVALEARSGANDLNFSIQSQAGSFSAAETRGRDARLDLQGSIPYPKQDMAKARGPVSLTGQIQLASLDGDVVNGKDVVADIDWNGQLNGWIDKFVLNGWGSFDVKAEGLASGQQSLSKVVFSAPDLKVSLSRGQPDKSDDRLNWRVEGPARIQTASLRSGETVVRGADLSSTRLLAGGDGKLFEVQGALALTAQGVDAGDLKLDAVRGQFRVDAVRGMATHMTVQGGLAANGRFSGLGPVTADDAPQLAQLKTAAQGFRLSAPDLAFSQTNRGNALVLQAPVTVRSANGAQLKLEAFGGPVLQLAEASTGGSARLSLAGADMPVLNLDVRRWEAGRNGFTARLGGDARLDFDPVQDIAVKTAGVLSVRNGVTEYRADGCSDIKAASVAVGTNSLTDLSGQICAEGRPLFRMNGGQWQMSGTLRQTEMSAPFAGANLAAGKGQLQIVGARGQTSLRLANIDATLSDTLGSGEGEDAKARFNPLQATGDVSLQNGIWGGGLKLAREGYSVADLTLQHQVESGVGRLDVSTGTLQFTQDGLQPLAISPMLADFIGSPAVGAVNLSGVFGWTAAGATSSGKMDIVDMSFATPAGQIEALSGQLVFTDLLNLTMAEDATFTARKLNAFLPVENLVLRARTRGKAVAVDEVGLSIGGGRVRASNLLVPFDRSQDVTGVLHLEQLEVNDLLAAANLRDKASFQAALTGDLGFRYNERLGWQIESGELSSDRGRLEISPEVLTGMSSEGGELVSTETDAKVEVPPNAMQDLAYQALENLAIDSLKAEVRSQPGGRLGIKFVIDGRHDPGVRKELRVSLIDLIRGDFMKKRLDLPTGTPVILTLNTSWNANELATEIFNVMRRRFEDKQGADISDPSTPIP